MKKIKAIILRAAGTNCDMETAYAFRLAGAETELLHINSLISGKKDLASYDILAVPGGFTYGDDIASGKILANEIKAYLSKGVSRFIRDGKLIIGICNGFQVLVKMGLLPHTARAKTGAPEATLGLNDSGRFMAKWVRLERPADEKCVWTKGLPEKIYLPIAHAEGKFIPGNDKVLGIMKKSGQIVFRYVDNPNGSVDNIAGICDTTGRIMGLMPHPERHISFLQHPNWRRMDRKSEDMGIGLEIFRNGVDFARKNRR